MDLQEILEDNGFRIDSFEDENGIEIETWTKAGVNMVHYLPNAS